jgi:predicted phosphodiesterase
MKYILDCISDTHNAHSHYKILPPKDLEDGDVWILLHAGDYSYHGYSKETKTFAKWLMRQPHPHKVVISGNHETMHDTNWVLKEREEAKAALEWAMATGLHHLIRKAEERLKSIKAVYPETILDGVAYHLNYRTVCIHDLLIYGDPSSLEFFDWGFMLKREDAADYWNSALPDGVDVVLVHGPPKWAGDACPAMDDPTKTVFVGDPDLGARLNVVKPKVCVYGHIHEGQGVYQDQYPDTLCVNASFMDGKYNPTQKFCRVVLNQDKSVRGYTWETTPRG